MIIYEMILSNKQSQLVRHATASAIAMAIFIAPCFYFSFLEVQNSAVRFPFILSAFLFVLRTFEGK